MRSKRARRQRDENQNEEETPETATEVETASEPEDVTEVGPEDLTEVVTAKAEGKPASTPTENVPAPPPPDIGATPEDILGLQVQMLDPAPEQTDASASESQLMTSPGTGSAPMEYYEERAAMAKEVLRAGSDHPRIARRNQKSDEQVTEVSTKPEEPQTDPDPSDDDVRVSDDVMITASKRDRRKLFGR